MKTTIGPVDYATDSSIERGTKEFLTALNTGGGKPIETMTPAEARSVLEGAQSSVPVDLSGIDVSEKTISTDGLTVSYYSTHQIKGESYRLLCFSWWWWCWEISRHINAW